MREAHLCRHDVVPGTVTSELQCGGQRKLGAAGYVVTDSAQRGRREPPD
jgi:hypothetical protein